MRVIRLFIPTLQAFYFKGLAGKKVFATLIAALALSGATLNPARELHSSINDDTESRAGLSVPLGLSRTRSDFIKAIDMLADGAAANRHLADYYESVTKRVKGTSAYGKSYSGINVLRRVRRTNSSRIDPPNVRFIAAADAGREVTPAGLDAYLEGAIAQESFVEPINPSEENVAQSQTNAPPQTPSAFTVGDMAFDTNPAIEHWMNWYSATPVGRRTMTIGITRSKAYLEMAREEFRNAGVPEDLVWLALVESVWNPQAVSPAAAGGIWQFIPSTATDYGLTVQSGNDERADPLKQTRVAAAYLHDLHTIFGDWALAMAAYNSGEPRVMSAIVKNGGADFWDLYDKQLLPKETCNYVPKILAAIKIASHAESYGLPQSQTEPSAGG
jgi:transglycosylase-like protein with SLT domain